MSISGKDQKWDLVKTLIKRKVLETFSRTEKQPLAFTSECIS